MADEANELLIFTEVDYSLWHILDHVDDCDLVVIRSHSLIGKQRVLNDPRLSHRLLWVVSTDFRIRFLLEGCREEVETQVIRGLVFVDNRTK